MGSPSISTAQYSTLRDQQPILSGEVTLWLKMLFIAIQVEIGCTRMKVWATLPQVMQDRAGILFHPQIVSTILWLSEWEDIVGRAQAFKEIRI